MEIIARIFNQILYSKRFAQPVTGFWGVWIPATATEEATIDPPVRTKLLTKDEA
jgi:hypothetical protein